MIRCTLAICSESVSLDALTNSVSIFHITDFINANSFPALHYKLTCFFIFKKDEEDPDTPEISVRITSNQETVVSQSPLEVDFGGKPGARNFITIQGLPIPAPGVLRVSAYAGEQELGYWEIIVNQLEVEPPTVKPLGESGA